MVVDRMGGEQRSESGWASGEDEEVVAAEVEQEPAVERRRWCERCSGSLQGGVAAVPAVQQIHWSSEAWRHAERAGGGRCQQGDVTLAGTRPDGAATMPSFGPRCAPPRLQFVRALRQRLEGVETESLWEAQSPPPPPLLAPRGAVPAFAPHPQLCTRAVCGCRSSTPGAAAAPGDEEVLVVVATADPAASSASAQAQPAAGRADSGTGTAGAAVTAEPPKRCAADAAGAGAGGRRSRWSGCLTAPQTPGSVATPQRRRLGSAA